MKKYVGILLNQAGLPQAQALIQVVQAGTHVLAPIFDSAMHEVGNPVTTDDGGQYGFWIRSGVYDFLDENDELLSEAVQIYDFTNPGEWLGVWDFPKLGFTFGGPGTQNMYGLTNTRLATDAGFRIGGMHDALETALTVIGSGGTADPLQIFLTSTDSEPMFTLDTLGGINIGAGGAIPSDVRIFRSAAGEIDVAGSLVVDDKFQHAGTTLGFFGAPPIAQPVINAGTISLPADQALYDLFVALAKLGIIAVNYTVTSVGTIAVAADLTGTRYVNATAELTTDTTASGVGTVA